MRAPRPPSMAVVVDHQHHHLKPPSGNRRHRLLSFPHLDLNNLDVHPQNPIISPRPSNCFHRSVSTPCLSSTDESPVMDYAGPVEVVMGRRAPGVNALVVETAIAMATGARPVPVPGGLGGAYYLPNRAGETFAVLKPVSHEPVGLALGQPGLRRSISVGETGVREVAAYLLDHGSFSGVPPTALIKIANTIFRSTATPSHRLASIQRFVQHDFDAGDLGPSRFSVSSVHRIGILDIRLLNVDRHSGNILVKSHPSTPSADLVPIDHGLCLPELLDDPYFEWLHWPQSSVPFSEPELDYISQLDPHKDTDLLRSELPLLREPSLRILTLCTVFLKRAAAAGICLADVGDMMTRRFSGADGGPRSVLETVCRKAEQNMAGFGLRYEDSKVNVDLQEQQIFTQFDMDIDDGRGPPTPPRAKSFLLKSGSCRPNMFELSGDEEKEEKRVVGSLTKSVSFSASEPTGKCISFKAMDEDEWAVFMEKFEGLLPEVFEERKNQGVVKQRLGTSCKF